MYMLNFLSRSLSNNIERINMDYEYTYITRLIKVMYNILYMIYCNINILYIFIYAYVYAYVYVYVFVNVYVYMYTYMSSDVNIQFQLSILFK